MSLLKPIVVRGFPLENAAARVYPLHAATSFLSTF